jgi:hypothetical protein
MPVDCIRATPSLETMLESAPPGRRTPPRSVGRFSGVIVEQSKRDLGPHRKCIALRASIAGVDRTYLPSDITVQVVEHEPDVAINVPVQACRIGRLLPAGDTICGGELVVEIDRADTPGELPCAPAAPGQREWVQRRNAVVSGGGRIIGVVSPVSTQLAWAYPPLNFTLDNPGRLPRSTLYQKKQRTVSRRRFGAVDLSADTPASAPVETSVVGSIRSSGRSLSVSV